MNRKSYYMFLFLLLGLFLIAGYAGYLNNQPKPELRAAVIGEHSFTSNPNIEYKSISWEDSVSERVPFVLVSDQIKITKKHKKKMKKWLDDGKVVLFFGEPLVPEDAVVKLDKVVPVVPLDGNVETVPILYGAYYYAPQKEYIPIFHLTSDPIRNMETRIQTFLKEVQHELLNEK